MSDEGLRLENLVQLAKEPSEEGRRRLLMEVTDLFFQSVDDLNDVAVGHFGGILGKVAREMEVSIRQNLAERMSESGWAPRDLMKQLARDEISVAQNVLMKSNVLTDEDLIAIIKETSQAHILAVTRRDIISEAVSDEIVDRGDDDAVESLIGNSGARFSPATLGRVVDKAEQNDTLHKPLATRRDLPTELLQRMYWFVSSQVRNQILMNAPEIDEAEIDAMISGLEHDITVNVKGFDPQTIEAADRYVANQEHLGNLNGDMLVQLLRRGQIPTFLAAFARLVQIDIETARRILYEDDGQALAMACRSAGVGRAALEGLLELLDQSGAYGPDHAKAILGIYDEIPSAAAKRAMRFWRTRTRTRDALR